MKFAAFSSLLALLGSSVHQIRANCTIKALNMAYNGLSVDVYDREDGVCWFTVPEGDSTITYQDWILLQDQDPGIAGCEGTAKVPCDTFVVYYLESGSLTYCTADNEYCEDSRSRVSRNIVKPEERQLLRGGSSSVVPPAETTA